jgi:hypothetical protein
MITRYSIAFASAAEAVEFLRGTPNYIPDLTDEQAAAIDAEIFECCECGWWCEWSEESLAVESVCVDCAPNAD